MMTHKTRSPASNGKPDNATARATARKPPPKSPAVPAAFAAAAEIDHGGPSAPSKLDRIVTLLSRPDGATLDELRAVTGWQAHSVRGALAGALRKRGHVINSEKAYGTRRYRIGGHA